MSGGLIIFLEIIAPLVVLIIYGRIKIVKARRKAEAEDTSAVTPALLFEPRPEPTPGPLLRPFSTPQRAYLRQQIALGKACCYMLSYVCIVIFTSGLLPQYVNKGGTVLPLAERVWYSYLEHAAVAEIVLVMVMLVAAMMALAGLTTGGASIFNRTRPLTQRFLFWARVLPAIVAILTSLATGIAVSLVLLLLFYGPVWLHLQQLTAPGTAFYREQHWAHAHKVLQTSAPRLFLSLATTSLLIFSAAAVFAGQSFWSSGKRQMTPLVTGASIFVGISVAHLIRDTGLPSFSRWLRMLFVYPSIGPPPPYAYVLVPILASTALLFIAQFWVARKEL
jgi:hypothetical protein